MDTSFNAGTSAVRMLREELQLLQEPGSYVGEVIKVRMPLAILLTGKSAFAWLALYSLLILALTQSSPHR